MQPLSRAQKTGPGKAAQGRAVKSDPAPSRWSYRMQRLMLTPMFRRGLRIGLPLGTALLCIGIYFADEARREAVAQGVADIRDQIQNRPEFQVSLMAIDGASPAVAEEIRHIVPVDFPISSFDLDLDEMHDLISDLPAIADAQVRIRQGGVLQIAVTERVPAALWRTREGLELVDASGAVVRPALMRSDHPTLPVIAGEGADDATAEALELVSAAGPLLPRLRGLVRMGERRWDVVLDRGQRILLPSEAPVQALERVIVLNQAEDMLARDLAVVDMRLADRPTLRMNETAMEEWWQIRQTVAGAGRE